MALTKTPIELSSTPGIVDNSNATAITIDSSENVGIGTTSPSQLLEISGATAPAIRLNDTTYNQYAEISTANAGSLILKADVGNGGTGSTYIGFEVDTAERMRIDSSGNVGIGISPAAKFDVLLGSTSRILLRERSSRAYIDSVTETNNAFDSLGINGSEILFETGGIERMRIDSSGNLLLHTTDNGLWNSSSNTSADTGQNINLYYSAFSRHDGQAVYMNRTGSDGTILQFNKSGTPVGSIGVHNSDNLAIEGNSTHSGLQFASNVILPHKNGALIDNAVGLGNVSSRFADLYLSGGVYLGGTGAANKLDDYEEGNWTPVLSGAGYSFGTHTGRYVKVGNLVYITALFNVTAVGSNNSIIAWSGAPFTALSFTNLHQMGVVRESSTTGRLYQIQINTGSSGGSLNSMDGIAGGSNEIFTTGNYGVSVTYSV